MDFKRGMLLCSLGVALSILLGVPGAKGQHDGDAAAPVLKISAANTKIEMMVNGARVLQMEQPIPRAQVANPDLLDFTPLSEKQVLIRAKKAGLTRINLWDDSDEVHVVDVVITADVRELDALIRNQFPTASVKLTPTSSSSLILSGYVDRTDHVNRIVSMAQEFYPKILNNMMVGGSQQVLLHVKVMEVSRTNLKNLGFDFANFAEQGFIASSPAGIINRASATTGLFRGAGALTTNGAETLQFGIINDPNGFVGFIEALKQEDLLKVLAEPNLVTVSGRPASYLVGGQIPYPQPTGFGNISINFKPFGTQIDFVPIVLGNGGVRLEVRPQVTELDRTIGVSISGTTVPGFRERMVDTGVELKFGQTLAIAGLLQQRTEMQKRGFPYLMDVPYLGALFSRKSNKINEVELLILVRPELVEALDPDQVPQCGPGMSSVSPDDCDLYWKGYMEVPAKGANLMGPGGPGGPGACPVPPRGPGNGGPEEVDTPPPAGSIPPAASRKRNGVVITDAPPQQRTPESTARRVANGSRRANPGDPQYRKNPTGSGASSSPPGFIGPLGYDVRK